MAAKRRRKSSDLTDEQEAFMEQVFVTNMRGGQPMLHIDQKQALCDHLAISESTVDEWFQHRRDNDVSEKRMKTNRRTSSRIRGSRAAIDFSIPLNNLTRPMRSVSNADLESLGMHCRDLIDAVVNEVFYFFLFFVVPSSSRFSFNRFFFFQPKKKNKLKYIKKKK